VGIPEVILSKHYIYSSSPQPPPPPPPPPPTRTKQNNNRRRRFVDKSYVTRQQSLRVLQGNYSL
jgi:hypothetical protein